MAGMQDVAILAEKYNILSENSVKLRRTISKMKGEAGK